MNTNVQCTHTRYELTLTLEEDLHTGSGVGGGTIDSFQTRDRKGNPVISRQHFKGLLRATAEQWQSIHQQLKPEEAEEDSELIRALLDDAEGEASGIHLALGSFYYSSGPQAASPFITWQSSARGKGDEPLNRAPKDDTLRTIEYVRAGCVFKARLDLISPQPLNKKLRGILEKLLRRISHFGASRNRGAGRVRLKISRLKTQEATAKAKLTTNAFEVQLFNTEALRLPTTQVPGNIIPTETYISGNRLRGALANYAKLSGHPDLFRALIAPSCQQSAIRIKNAYPSPEGIRSVPWPIAIEVSKPSADDDTLPWWFQSETQQYRQTTARETQENEGAKGPDTTATENKFKRNKGPVYLFEKGAGWHVFKQPSAIHMRNKVRTATATEDDSALFSEEVLPEGCFFSTRIHCDDSTLLGALFDLLRPAGNTRTPLYLGRGKASCEVTTTQPVPLGAQSPEEGKPLTLVTESAWLVYDTETLEPYESLSVAALNAAFELELTPEQIEQYSQHCEHISDTTTLTGFNYASGLPKKPVTAIAGGSTLQIRSSELIQTLRQTLSDGAPAGDRTQDGLGAYWWYQGDLCFHKAPETDLSANDNPTENIRLAVNKILNKEIRSIRKLGGSVSQWRNLLSAIESELRKNNSSPKAKGVSHALNRYINLSNVKKNTFYVNFTESLIQAWQQELQDQTSAAFLYSLEFSKALIREVILELKADHSNAAKENADA